MIPVNTTCSFRPTSSPRAAPTPPSSRSSPSPQGFIVPRIPPPNCPLHVTHTPDGPQLPRVSDSPLPIDDDRVSRLIQFTLTAGSSCTSCYTAGLECDFTEAGIPCPCCVVLGVPNCDFIDPDFFLHNLADRRDQHFHDECWALCAFVRENCLLPCLFECEYERSCEWFYSVAHGAITRYLYNCKASHEMAVRGYASRRCFQRPQHALAPAHAQY
ncbi:hypothetical protein K438DRAFT_1925898 [Mycena galopus ATCC 62051]|nr:hypothetical protein K438DRAFT_1925898 [Mycena galopus ATCC 62051]